MPNRIGGECVLGCKRAFLRRVSNCGSKLLLTIFLTYALPWCAAGPPAVNEQHATTDPKQATSETLRTDPDVFAPVDVEVTILSGQELSFDEEASASNRQFVLVTALVPFERQAIEFQRALLHSRGYLPHRDTPRYIGYTAQRAAVEDESAALDWKLISFTQSERKRQFSEPLPITLQELADSRYVSFPLTMPAAVLVGPSLGSQCLHSTVPRQSGHQLDGKIAKHLMIRFTDRTVEIGKKYRYRVGAFLSDPNRPDFSQFDPVFGDLAPTVQERIAAIEKQEQAKGTRRFFYRRTPWSEPSRMVEVLPTPNENLVAHSSRVRRINKSEPACLVYSSQWSTEPHRDGLILGVWSYGTIVWSLDHLRGGPPYYQSKIDPNCFQELRQKLRAEGAFADRSLSASYGSLVESIVPCTDETRIILNDRDETLDMQSWHEFQEARGRVVTNRESLDAAVVKWDALLQQPKDYLRFRLAWSEIRLGLKQLIPKNGDQVDGSLVFSEGRIAWIESPLK